jgi:tripartite-type tricarboxylate transporter receptor subunit TctC
MAAVSDYPTKPIEILVGMAPGGGTDLTTRMLVENAKKYLGQEFIVTNRPGANNRIAMTSVYKAKPDGYTLGAASDYFITLTPLFEKVPYRPEDFTFITKFGSQANSQRQFSP